MQAHRRQAHSPHHHRGLTLALDEHAQHRLRETDQQIARDVRARADDELRAEAVAAVVAVDEPELGQRSQVSVSRRLRHVEQHRELVGADRAPIGDDEQQAESSRERGILRRFLGGVVTSRGHASHSPRPGDSRPRARDGRRPCVADIATRPLFLQQTMRTVFGSGHLEPLTRDQQKSCAIGHRRSSSAPASSAPRRRST